MGEHPDVNGLLGIHVDGGADMAGRLVVTAQEAEDAGQIEVGVVVVRGQLYGLAAEQQGQVRQSVLPQAHAKIPEHMFVPGGDVFFGLSQLFQSGQRRLAFFGTFESEQGLAEGFPQIIFRQPGQMRPLQIKSLSCRGSRAGLEKGWGGSLARHADVRAGRCGACRAHSQTGGRVSLRRRRIRGVRWLGRGRLRGHQTPGSCSTGRLRLPCSFAGGL